MTTILSRFDLIFIVRDIRYACPRFLIGESMGASCDHL